MEHGEQKDLTANAEGQAVADEAAKWEAELASRARSAARAVDSIETSWRQLVESGELGGCVNWVLRGLVPMILADLAPSDVWQVLGVVQVELRPIAEEQVKAASEQVKAAGQRLSLARAELNSLPPPEPKKRHSTAWGAP